MIALVIPNMPVFLKRRDLEIYRVYTSILISIMTKKSRVFKSNKKHISLKIHISTYQSSSKIIDTFSVTEQTGYYISQTYKSLV